jgi:hypothetical protein
MENIFEKRKLGIYSTKYVSTKLTRFINIKKIVYLLHLKIDTSV